MSEPAKSNDRVQTRDAVAKHFGVHVRTVAQWINDGMPGTPGTTAGGAGGDFSLTEIAQWLESRRSRSTAQVDSERKQALARIDNARAARQENALRNELAQLVSTDHVIRHNKRVISEARSQIEQLPGRVLACLPQDLDDDRLSMVRREIKRCIDVFCETLEMFCHGEAAEEEKQVDQDVDSDQRQDVTEQQPGDATPVKATPRARRDGRGRFVRPKK